MSENTHAYIGREACGHATLAVVDDPAHQKDTYRELNAAARRGQKIERVTIDEARAALKEWSFAEFDHGSDGRCIPKAVPTVTEEPR